MSKGKGKVTEADMQETFAGKPESQEENAPPPPPKPTALAKAEPEPEIIERVRECLDSLETFANAPLPMIRFKEGFSMGESEDDIGEFEGVIIYTKEMNAYYKSRYKPGEKRQPDCFSPDGKVPTSETKEAVNCAACPHNKFGSAAEGDGKACKNVRPVYVLVKNEETGDFSVIPKMLRVPPTSLGLIRSYVMNVAADFGAYFAVSTKFRVFQKSEAQTHYNIGFSLGKRLDAQQRANVNFIRNGWMDRLKGSTAGVDEHEAEPAAAPAPAAEGAAPNF